MPLAMADEPKDVQDSGEQEPRLGTIISDRYKLDALVGSGSMGRVFAGEHVLLTLHPRVGRWIQLGGHCEPGDATLRAAALREATEESGIAGLTIAAEPLHVDVHPVTCSLGVPTRHLDVRYLVRAPAGAQPVISDESDDLRWWPVSPLPPESDTVPAMVVLAGLLPSLPGATGISAFS